jgi:hypothetical protein
MCSGNLNLVAPNLVAALAAPANVFPPVATPRVTASSATATPDALSSLVHLQETADRTVVALLHLFREITGGKLLLHPVIADAFTADTLALAWLIGAVALLEILLVSQAFHARMITVFRAAAKRQPRLLIRVSAASHSGCASD